MITGMSTSCFFGRLTVEEAIDVMAKMGVKTAEIFLNTFSEYEPGYISELKKRIDDTDISVFSVHPHGVQYEPQLFSRYERSRIDAEVIYRKVLEAASVLGAKRYVCHGSIALKRNGSLPDMQRIAKTVDRLCDIASEYDVRFCYENVHWCLFNRPEFATELLKYTDNKNLGFTLDVKQAAQSGYEILDYAKAMSYRISDLHICDFVREPNGVRPVLPPNGELDIPALKSALKDYNGAAILEVYGDNYKDFAEFKTVYDKFTKLFD